MKQMIANLRKDNDWWARIVCSCPRVVKSWRPVLSWQNGLQKIGRISTWPSRVCVRGHWTLRKPACFFELILWTVPIVHITTFTFFVLRVNFSSYTKQLHGWGMCVRLNICESTYCARIISCFSNNVNPLSLSLGFELISFHIYFYLNGGKGRCLRLYIMRARNSAPRRRLS